MLSCNLSVDIHPLDPFAILQLGLLSCVGVLRDMVVRMAGMLVVSSVFVVVVSVVYKCAVWLSSPPF